MKKQKQPLLNLEENYLQFLTNVKERLKNAQIRAALAANKELIHFYWQLGKDLIKYQENYKWGERFIEQFSQDIRKAFPEMQGFSVTNLKRMRILAKEYPDLEKSPRLVDGLPWASLAAYPTF